MKKFFILMSAAVLALSCAKELTDNQEANYGEYKTVTFESVATKTTIAESGEVAWEAGDKISVYYVNAEGAAAEAIATATSAGFFISSPSTNCFAKSVAFSNLSKSAVTSYETTL